MDFYSFDAVYLERLSAGDPDTERHFTKYFSDLILIKLRSRQHSREAIEDIRQETFLRVLQTIRKNGIRDPERIGAFVNSVCNNVMLEHFRAGKKLTLTEEEPPERPDQQANAEQELVTRQEQTRVRTVLSRISAKNRRLLSAIFLEERPSAEVCRQFGVDQNYLRVLLFRARAQFKQAMEEDQGPTGRKL
jgi:RNA polymerase sigma-70 factor (ECF subfamily)